MTFILTPTRTAAIFQTIENGSKTPIITAVARKPDTPSLVLGPGTCGFAAGSAVTCESGYDCVNVGSYRGCCVAGAEDCRATIYTSCVNYEAMPNAAMCGPHTLCCPESKAYCVTYAHEAGGQPEAAFTHLRCAEAPGSSELCLYPPVLITTTKGLSTEKTQSPLSVQPADSENYSSNSSSNSVSSGATVGAVVGGVIFVILVIASIFICLGRRRRRQRNKHVHNGNAGSSTEFPSSQNEGTGKEASTGPLHSLSTIHEQQSSVTSASSKESEAPAPSTLQLHNLGENWPLGGPISPRKPLSSHPIREHEKRAIQNEPPEQRQSNNYRESDASTLQPSTPLSPGTHLSPPPLRWSRDGSTGAIGTASQSPRLSFIPPPVIDTTFGEDVERTLNDVGEHSHGTLRKSESVSSGAPFFATATNHEVYIHPNLGISNDFGPVVLQQGGDNASADRDRLPKPGVLPNVSRGELDP
ncbi:hypothetical protein F5Y07DRAFT_406465 [Xylaria sp. FL0933]|nr:hypothetical protein F5Y07DRAFT_406465 [Xylaria sp. FL0933]